MIWSFSASKAFKRCQRQWYFKNCLASARAKDPIRRKAYLLGKLQSLSAWRGNIVDLVISETIVPAVNRNRCVTLAQAKTEAFDIFERQLACAREHRIHDSGFSPSKLGSNFAAFHCMEYGDEIPENKILQARTEIDQALTNLFSMRGLCERLKSADYLISQRPLTFHHSGVSVKAVPDLIAFYREQPPLIVDWKVHTFGIQDARLQLVIYAIALKRCKPHCDFPKALSQSKETETRLVEAQLLTNQIREHELSEARVNAVEAYIAESANEIMLAVGEDKTSNLDPSDFAVARSPEVCQRCAYKSICWEVAS